MYVYDLELLPSFQLIWSTATRISNIFSPFCWLLSHVLNEIAYCLKSAYDCLMWTAAPCLKWGVGCDVVGVLASRGLAITKDTDRKDFINEP